MISIIYCCHIFYKKGAPASSISDVHIHGELSDAEKIFELAKISDVITYEIEHINIAEYLSSSIFF